MEVEEDLVDQEINAFHVDNRVIGHRIVLIKVHARCGRDDIEKRGMIRD